MDEERDPLARMLLRVPRKRQLQILTQLLKGKIQKDELEYLEAYTPPPMDDDEEGTNGFFDDDDDEEDGEDDGDDVTEVVETVEAAPETATGKSAQDPPIDTESFDDLEKAERQRKRTKDLMEYGMMEYMVDVNRTTKVTRKGSLMSFNALMLVGNGDGLVGFGSAKAPETDLAIDKATRHALRNLYYVDRARGKTFYHPVEAKFGKTQVKLWPAKSGAGARGNKTVEAILDLAGVKDAGTKVHGSAYSHNVVKATFMALDRLGTPVDVARGRGVRLDERYD